MNRLLDADKRRAAEARYKKSALGKTTRNERNKERRLSDPEWKAKRYAASTAWRAKNLNYGNEWKYVNRERVLFYMAKQRAKKAGLEFSIGLVDIHIPALCPYLGIVLQFNRAKRHPANASIDRIDSSKGYIPGNIEIISWRANHIKNSATLEELVAMGKAAQRMLRNGK